MRYDAAADAFNMEKWSVASCAARKSGAARSIFTKRALSVPVPTGIRRAANGKPLLVTVKPRWARCSRVEVPVKVGSVPLVPRLKSAGPFCFSAEVFNATSLLPLSARLAKG